MTDSEQRQLGLAGLARDVLSPEWPSAELLLRYVDDAARLEPDERRELELAIERLPALADQVETLRSLDPSALLASAAEAEAEALASEPPASRSRTRNLLPLVREWLVPRAAALAAAAAVVAVFFVWPGQDFEPGREPVPTRSARGPEEAPPPQAPPRVVARHGAVRPGVYADGEVSYRFPESAAEQLRLESAVSLGAAGELRGVAIVPEHVAQTSAAAPSVFWHLTGPVPEHGEFLLQLARPATAGALMEIRLARPVAPGMQQIQFRELGIELPVGIAYRWIVVFEADPSAPAQPLAQGWVERRELPASLRDLTSSEPLARARAFAAGGFWYDALEAVHPPEGPLPVARRSLLASIGLANLGEEAR